MPKFNCGNCGSEVHTLWRYVVPQKGQPYERCDSCEAMKRPRTYDDVFKGDCNKGMTECEHIADPETGKPIPYSTPGEKAAILERLHLKQSDKAERVHGSRNETKRRTYFV